MAVRAAVITRVTDGVLVVTWSGLLNGDNGEPVLLPHASDKSWHVTGTPGVGGVARPKGYNRNSQTVDTTKDPILNDATSTLIAGTVDIMDQVLENPLYIYPHVTAGDGSTNLEVRMAVKGDRV